MFVTVALLYGTRGKRERNIAQQDVKVEDMRM
jgi:hypothetical protein